ncbi:MAG TPA: tRNA lysidine(34) synthetase TilS [Campylobacterales bacterium]|nr:tRNA lysidine(34) synthetase TilS [Campylobacterales bacterium]
MEHSLKLSSEFLSHLKGKKNLLAFSAGVDSSALFFLLLEHDIVFDIALVNYGLREQSKEEEAYALTLAQEHNLQAHISQAPSFSKNFEKNARDFRYEFFDVLMQKHAYDNLLTAHQLNDQLEWLLMRLTKGAGTAELIGLEGYSTRKNYALVRPLLEHSKKELLKYLNTNKYTYFIDESNSDNKYERNLFRNKFANELMDEYSEGIRRSFRYLKEDKVALTKGFKEVFHEKELYILSYDSEHLIIRLVDKYLKKLGYLLSSAQRLELKKETSLVFGGVWAVEVQENLIFIAPYRNVAMPKIFKEACRKLKIASKIRSYLFEEEIAIKKLSLSF